MFEIYNILTGVLFAVGLLTVLIYVLRNELNNDDYDEFDEFEDEEDNYDWWKQVDNDNKRRTNQ